MASTSEYGSHYFVRRANVLAFLEGSEKMPHVIIDFLISCTACRKQNSLIVNLIHMTT